MKNKTYTLNTVLTAVLAARFYYFSSYGYE